MQPLKFVALCTLRLCQRNAATCESVLENIDKRVPVSLQSRNLSLNIHILNNTSWINKKVTFCLLKDTCLLKKLKFKQICSINSNMWCKPHRGTHISHYVAQIQFTNHLNYDTLKLIPFFMSNYLILNYINELQIRT